MPERLRLLRADDLSIMPEKHGVVPVAQGRNGLLGFERRQVVAGERMAHDVLRPFLVNPRLFSDVANLRVKSANGIKGFRR